MIREDKILARVEILLIFVFFSLCREQTLSAGTGVSDYYLSSVIDVNDGLRNPNANGIFRDDKGFVWISTFGGGLERYDGESLVSFAPQENMLIRSAYLTNSVQDDHDRLWSAGIKGIDIIDLRTLSVVSPPGELAATYDGCYIPDVVRAEDGGIWYCARNFLYRVVMDGIGDSVEIDSLKCSDMDMNMRLILGDVDRDGSIWTSHNGQIIKIVHNTGGGLVMREAIPGLSIGETNKASCFLRSGDKVWIGTQTGLFCIDSTTGEVRIYHHDASDQNSLSNDEVTCIAATNDGEVVVGTLGGVSIYDSSEDSFVNYKSTPGYAGAEVLPGDLVRSLCVIENQIWVGLQRDGIAVLRKKRLPIRNVSYRESDPRSLPNAPVPASFVDSRGHHWFGVTEYGLCLFNEDTGNRFFNTRNSSLYHNTISSFTEDCHGTMWMSMADGHLNSMRIDNLEMSRPAGITPKIARQIDYINQILYDKYSDAIWILSRTGAYIYDIRQDRVRVYDDALSLCFSGGIDSDGRLWLGHQAGIKCIDLTTGKASDYPDIKVPLGFAEDQYGRVWIGTFDNGLYRIETGNDGKPGFIHYGLLDGLADNRIRALLADGDYLWISTENGLSRLNVTSDRIESFFVQDGLKCNAFCENSICKDMRGAVFMGHKQGISVLESSYVRVDDMKPVRVMLTRGFTRTGEVNLAYEDGVSIKEKDRYLSFSFSDLTYSQNGNVVYSSRIYPLDKEWRTLQRGMRTVTYGGISSGHYKIQVRATDARGTVLSQDECSLYVRPAFYKTWWFILLALSMSAGAVLLFIKVKIRFVEKQRVALQKEVDCQTRLLSEQKAQLQRKTEELSEQNKILVKQIEELAGRRMLLPADGDDGSGHKRSGFVEDWMSVMQKLYKDSELDVDKAAEAMNMSRSVLNDKLQKALGQSIAQYIRTYRLHVARELILAGGARDMNVSILAYEVGFSDSKYFTRCFSKEFGVAPSVMMRQVSE